MEVKLDKHDKGGYQIPIRHEHDIIELITQLAALLRKGHDTVKIGKEFVSTGDELDYNEHEGYYSYYLHSEY